MKERIALMMPARALTNTKQSEQDLTIKELIPKFKDAQTSPLKEVDLNSVVS